MIRPLYFEVLPLEVIEEAYEVHPAPCCSHEYAVAVTMEVIDGKEHRRVFTANECEVLLAFLATRPLLVSFNCPDFNLTLENRVGVNIAQTTCDLKIINEKHLKTCGTLTDAARQTTGCRPHCEINKLAKRWHLSLAEDDTTAVLRHLTARQWVQRNSVILPLFQRLTVLRKLHEFMITEGWIPTTD